jgi:limonene-1,2-epoxide hydrolase
MRFAATGRGRKGHHHRAPPKLSAKAMPPVVAVLLAKPDENWSIEVLRIVAQGNTVVSEVRVPHPTVGPYYALSFYEVDDGQIASCREYWVIEAYEEPVAERARWFEPM